MDDLKMFAKDDDNLDRLLQTVKNFSDDIGIKFGLSKGVKAPFERERLVRSTLINLVNSTTTKKFINNLVSTKATEYNMPP